MRRPRASLSSSARRYDTALTRCVGDDTEVSFEEARAHYQALRGENIGTWFAPNPHPVASALTGPIAVDR